MTRAWRALLLGLALILTLLTVVGVAPTEAAPAATHSISVATTHGAGMYPAYADDIDRFAVTTSTQTGGTVAVTAVTSDPNGTVVVDGRPTTADTTTVLGLSEGDEISVIFVDSAGTERHSLVYLPAGFPRLTEVVPAASGTMTGDVLVNLSTYANDGTANYEAALDHRGVPSYVKGFFDGVSPSDLKPLGATGHYTSSRVGGTPGVYELDSAFKPVRSFTTVDLSGVVDTHDAIIRPDGSRILLAYQPNSQTHLTDAVIQEVAANGSVVYTWNSGDHITPADETTAQSGQPDYAHINSIQQLDNGDILASFRHLSSVYRIAWSAHDGYQRGDVIWKLGGRHSSFSYVDDADGGPCAQHDARMLANGNIVLFDNGSAPLGTQTQSFCPDPDNPTGPTVSRAQTRVSEYQLDLTAHTAKLVWSYEKPGWWTLFAGSAQRLANGNTLVGWASKLDAIASEVSPSGTLLWELKQDGHFLSYRATKAEVPDTVKPAVSVTRPVNNASYAYGQAVTPDFTCTDRGGSSLQTCSGSRTPLDTRSPGRHTYVVTATDGAGNTTRANRSYTIGAAPFSRPDASVRLARGRTWVGSGVYGVGTSQHVTGYLPGRHRSVAAVVRVQASGNRTDTYRLTGSSGTPRLVVHYFVGGVDVTSAMTGRASILRTLPAGGHVDVLVRITRLRGAHRGKVVQGFVRATSQLDRRADAAGLVGKARRQPRH